MPITWPKIVRISDLVDVANQLDQRITTLEAYVIHNDQRITTLEAAQHADSEGLAAHQAGAVERQAELDRLRAELDRQAWYVRTGRKP